MSERTRIHVLSDAVINKIAAGEVVDRPASVVKELVENSLDAGARRIQVEVVAGGRTLISVTDDGEGMSRDDALLSIERHATSKIRDVDDIERIATLGFRGEALAAIAAVSRMTLQTARREDAEGTEITVHAGRVLDVQPIGCPPGTRIVVRNLFFNVPARRRFLRTEQTELAQVRQTLWPYLLAWPEVGFEFTVDGRRTLQVRSGETLADRLAALYGRPVSDAFRPLEAEAGRLRITGFVALPQASRGDRAEQFVFVNRRPAGAPVLQHALNEAYQGLIPRGRYPVLFVFIELPSEDVDVNVHPTKKEVRFRRPGEVRDLLISAIRSALGYPGLTSVAVPIPDQPKSTGPSGPIPSLGQLRPTPSEQATSSKLSIPDLPPTRVFAHPRLVGPAPAPSSPQEPRSEPNAAITCPTGRVEPAASASGVAPPWSWCRVLGQVGGLFVILEMEDGLVVMDPHAAHERVIYDRWMGELEQGRPVSQPLLIPETVELSDHDAERVSRNLAALDAMGFGISEFGPRSFIVDAVPSVLGVVSVARILPEIAASLEESGPQVGSERWVRESIASAACRAAVKARDILKLEEVEQLVVDLAKTRMPYTCPHGRPTLLHFSFSDLRRKFGRTG